MTRPPEVDGDETTAPPADNGKPKKAKKKKFKPFAGGIRKSCTFNGGGKFVPKRAS